MLPERAELCVDSLEFRALLMVFGNPLSSPHLGLDPYGQSTPAIRAFCLA